MMLDIIVPHYNEPFEVGKKLFDMLGIQRCVDFDSFRVILVHDGSELFPKKLLKYPYRIDQYKIPHGGVSAARNYGMDQATAKWVAFCDFDDTYADIYAMKFLMEALETNDHDLLWGPILMEEKRGDGMVVLPLMKFNMVFIHNKYMRLEYLREHKLRFNERLAYAEDSSFLAVMNVLVKHERIGKIVTPQPIYTWAYRDNSCTTNDGNMRRNVQHLFDANRYISMEFERLNYRDAGLMKWRAVCDAYVTLNREEAQADEELVNRVRQFWYANRQEIGRQDRTEIRKVYEASIRNGMRGKAGQVPKIPIAEWLNNL